MVKKEKKTAAVSHCPYCGYHTVIQTEGKIYCPKCHNLFSVEPDTSFMDFSGEMWADVVGYEDIYQVSNYLRVRSLPQTDSLMRKRDGKWMSVYDKNNELYVSLWKNGSPKEYNVKTLCENAFSVGP